MKKFIKGFFGLQVPVLSSIEAYQHWADSYPAKAHNKLMEIEEASMGSLLPDLGGKLVLDLACGTGRYSHIAREAGAKSVIGLDNSVAMLVRNSNSANALSTMEAIPLPAGSIDCVICGLACGHLLSLDDCLREISRVTKPGGYCLISDFHPYQYLSGARRTFRSGSRTYAVEHYVHQISDYFSSGLAHQLRLEAVQEPVYHENIPVVLVMQFQKMRD